MKFRIYTRAGDLPFRRLIFPDGQRHIELQAPGWDDFPNATIEARIANADELFDVLLAKDALSASGYAVSLDIRYLLGARMDRRITLRHPLTLEIVARIINGAGFRRVRVLDPHSGMALSALNATAVYPLHALAMALSRYRSDEMLIVAPDAGARPRIANLLSLLAPAMGRERFRVLQGGKVRDPETGALRSFTVEDPSSAVGKTCLIVDDICDRGGTFVGLAEVLLAAGAAAVDLFVTHGIFSAGGTLPGIRTIYTTDSYHSIGQIVGPTTVSVSMERPERSLDGLGAPTRTPVGVP